MILQTICETGIRISELQYFTVEQVKRGRIEILNKGKYRVILPVSYTHLDVYKRQVYRC